MILYRCRMDNLLSPVFDSWEDRSRNLGDLFQCHDKNKYFRKKILYFIIEGIQLEINLVKGGISNTRINLNDTEE